MQAVAKAFKHEKHWKDINQILETFAEKSCKNQCNEVYRNLPSGKSQERIHTKDKLIIEVLMKCKYGQKDEGIHTEVKPFVCKHCEEAFIDSIDLISHEKIHTGDKSYICKQCGKTFKYTSCFEKHKVSHKGEKLYSCKYCRKVFTHSYSRNIHESIHTGEKLYTCKHCGKSFTSPTYFKVHERLHTGENPTHVNIVIKPLPF